MFDVARMIISAGVDKLDQHRMLSREQQMLSLKAERAVRLRVNDAALKIVTME